MALVQASLGEALHAAALQAKQAYEAAYDQATKTELQRRSLGADAATMGEVALHAISQCEWVMEHCRGLGDGVPITHDVPSNAASMTITSDEMPDWLADAAEHLAPPPPRQAVPQAEPKPARSESFRRRRRTRKTND